jgi:hypothetical protein
MRRSLCALIIATARLAAFAAVSLSISSASADEPIRWKFKVGDKFDYYVILDVNMTAGSDETTAAMRQELDMTWEVQGVDLDSGEAIIRQKFERIKTKLTSPKKTIDYDSKSEDPPSDSASRLAPVYKALIQNEVEITMTARGEVKDVKIPDEVLAALKSSPGAAELGEMTTAEGFKKMVTQGLMPLPKDAPKAGETWSSKLETENLKGGKQVIETIYRYDGTKDIDGVTYAVIKPEQKFSFVPPPENTAGPDSPPPKITVADQSSDGEVLFNLDAGRLHSMTVDNSVTVDTTSAGKSIRPKIEQKIVLKLSPFVEKKSDDATKADPNKPK